MPELTPLDPQLAAAVPAEVAEEIAAWQGDAGRELIFDHWLDLGNTSARVAAVGVRGGGEDARKMILKICPPDRTTAREPRRHKEALEKSPAAFAASHLVGQPIEPVQLKPSNWWLLFQEIAGGSLKQVRPLFSLVDNVELPKAAVQVVESLLNDWNPRKDLRRMSVPEFFSAALGTRIEPGGPIPTWATESGLPESPWLLIGDDVVPNPAVWAQTELAEDLTLMAVLGNAHGDLHLQNILLPMNPLQPEEFRLIDLSGYGADAPLARDPMHLLLSTLLPVLDDFSAGQKVELLTILTRLPYEERAPSLGLQGTYLLARGVYDAGLSAMTGAGMRDDWADQTALALSATALMFTTLPRLSEEARGWFFELAARALGQYLARAGQTVARDAAVRYGARTLRTRRPRSSLRKPVITSAAAA